MIDNVGWLVVLRIYVALAVFQPYRDLEAGDNQYLKFKWRGGESNPGPLAPQAKSLTTRPPKHFKSRFNWLRSNVDDGMGDKLSLLFTYISQQDFMFSLAPSKSSHLRSNLNLSIHYFQFPNLARTSVPWLHSLHILHTSARAPVCLDFDLIRALNSSDCSSKFPNNFDLFFGGSADCSLWLSACSEI